jgi:hypothetical protein
MCLIKIDYKNGYIYEKSYILKNQQDASHLQPRYLRTADRGWSDGTHLLHQAQDA